MGKGDKKSKRGKIHIGSYGKTRPRKDVKSIAVVEVKEEKKKPVAKPKKIETPEALTEVLATEKPKKAPAKPKKESAEQPDLFEGADQK